MTNLLTNENNTKQEINKKLFYIKAEKLIRQANDNITFFKDYELALDQIEEVLRIDPENAKAFLLKGNIFFCLDEMDTALECFEQAIQFKPWSAQAYSLKANILDIIGNPVDALEACENAFKNMRKRDYELMTALYDQKIAILIKLKKYEEARKTVKESFKNLDDENSSYIASCYRDVIDALHKERKRKKSIAVKRLKVIHS